MQREPSPALSTTSCSATTESSSSRSTTPSLSDVPDVRAPTLTPATSFSSIGEDEDEDGSAPKDATEDLIAPHDAAEGGAKVLSPRVEQLKALSLSEEGYSHDGNPAGCSPECTLTRSLLRDLQDYHQPKPKETKRERDRRMQITDEYFAKVGEGERHCLICVNTGRTPFNLKKTGRYELAKHLRIHLCDEHKPFKCRFPGCPQTHTQKSNMASHLNGHTGETLPCKWCGEGTNNSTALYRHSQGCLKNPDRKPADESLPYVAVMFQAEENRVENQHEFILGPVVPEGPVWYNPAECDMAKSFPTWNWKMLRSTTYTFDGNIGKLKPVKPSTCVFDWKPPVV